MPNFLQNRPPRLADVQCCRVDWQPGDRIIVKLRTNVDADWKKRMRKSIRKFARCEVEVLFINELAMDIEVQKGMAGMPCPVCGKSTAT